MRSIVLSLFLVFSFVTAAAADDLPNRVFNGKIMTSAKRYPTSAKSQSAYVAAIRKQSTSNFMEDKTDHTWMVYFAAFLKKPFARPLLLKYVRWILDGPHASSPSIHSLRRVESAEG